MVTHNKSIPLQYGFTLAELMIALAIGAILLTMAVPAFSTMLEENRITSRIYDFIAQINYARSHAITSGKHVVFCKSSDGASCDKNAGWGEGWISFVDSTSNSQRDDDEPLLHVTQINNASRVIDFSAFGSDDYITFQSTGMLKAGNGTFTFCPRNKEIAPRAVILAKTGRLRISRVKPDGDPLNCPE